MSRCLTGALIVLVLRPILCGAQAWEVFDMNNAGLPSNTVHDLAADGQGNIWAATDWGLCRYDGSTWTVFQTANSGLTDNVLNAVEVDTLDRVWIGTQQHGVVVFDGSTWQEYSTSNSPMPDDEVKTITIDHRGWVWIGTFVGLVCYTGSEWRIYNDSPGSYGGLLLNGNVVQDIAVRPDGLVALGTLNYGFHYLTDTSVQVHATYIDFFPDNTQNGVAFDPLSGERWLSTPSQGLVRQGGNWWNGPWFQYTTGNSNIPANSLTCVEVDSTGSVWIGSLSAGLIVRSANGTYLNYTSQNSGLPDNSVEDVLFAPDGATWVATYFGGVARFDPVSGVDPRDRSAQVLAWPNPAADRLTVHVPDVHGPLEWRSYDMFGRLMGVGSCREAEACPVDLAGLSAGTYQFTVTWEGGSGHTRIVVEH